MSRATGRLILTILAALLCGGLLAALNVPGAWLSGAVIATVLVSMAGCKAAMPKPLLDAAMLVAGLTMGSAITPEALAAFGSYPVSLALLVATILSVTAGSALFLMRWCGWGRDDAVLASLPGAMTTVLAIAIGRDADVARIAVVQSFRLLVLVLVLPFVVSFVGQDMPAGGALAGREISGTGAFLLMAGLAGLVGLAFERLGLSTPFLLGGTLVSAVLHASNLTPGIMAPELSTFGFLLIGVAIGERLNGLDRTLLRGLATAAIGSCLIGIVIAAVFAAIVPLTGPISFGDAIVAFAPGGVEAMIVMALVLGLDPLYVMVHHFTRFFGIAFTLPFIYRVKAPVPNREAAEGQRSAPD